MQKIDIVIRPDKIEDLKQIFDECDVRGAMFSNIMGYGNQKGHKTTRLAGRKIDINLLPKIKAEVVVSDETADKLIDLISEKMSTGEYGDGKIFIYELSDVIRIRTKEHGDSAL